MPHYLRSSANRVVIHTGNIYSINEVKIKAGQSPTEELVESLNFILNKHSSSTEEASTNTLVVNEKADYETLNLAIPDNRKDIKVNVKIFVADFDGAKIKEAFNSALHALNTPFIESVVLALRATDPPSLETIKNMWLVLEEFVLSKLVYNIGVSDVETETFVSLYEWAKVKPGIVQINLAHCCVVPPALQNFTREHEIRLLTHSDSPNILPDSVVNEVVKGSSSAEEISDFKFKWAARYQVHFKCRGVLSSKGYIVCLEK